MCKIHFRISKSDLTIFVALFPNQTNTSECQSRINACSTISLRKKLKIAAAEVWALILTSFDRWFRHWGFYFLHSKLWLLVDGPQAFHWPFFASLWQCKDENIPIAAHLGKSSLDSLWRKRGDFCLILVKAAHLNWEAKKTLIRN